MFGLGLYIYAGEDLPEVTDEVREEAERAEAAARKAAEPKLSPARARLAAVTRRPGK